ncbi:lysophospholipid acyltransferase family protein [candidate division KSB1 bacterium]|nr:lysophospholipid acyltransferase family protein [candidate division KSB1 bacterium]
MDQFDVKAIIESKDPRFFSRLPGFVGTLFLKIINRVLHVSEVNAFVHDHADKSGIDFIDQLFEELDFSYSLTSKDRERIPAEGKLVCVSNHPLGGLDGLALLRAVSEVRPDVKIVVNDILMRVDNLSELFLPYDIFSRKMQRKQIHAIKTSLMNEEAVIFFPAAEVSRLTMRGIRDGAWQSGALRFAKEFDVPVLPFFIKSRNTIGFYLFSVIYKKLSIFLLVDELFHKRGKAIEIKVGDPISGETFKSEIMNFSVQKRLLKKHVYRIGRNRPPIFKTEKTIIHPRDRKKLKSELLQTERLAQTGDGKDIFLVEYKSAPTVVNEIARLRELTFRRVGEGTGNKSDFDRFDRLYKHIVLWDNAGLEIVGAYRIGLSGEIIEKEGVEGLYNSTLFRFSPQFIDLLPETAELGRSFIQYRYWKSNALDHLWQGIGALLQRHPEIRYLFGAVSISDNYSEDAKNLIVYFYQKWYGSQAELVVSKNRFLFSKNMREEMDGLFTNTTIEADFRVLKETLKNYGYTVPVLFRQYTDLCEGDGIQFLDFGVDRDFNNCVDGLIFLHLDKLKAKKRERYFPLILHADAPTQTEPV